MREISASAHARARVWKDEDEDARRGVFNRSRGGMNSGPPPAAPSLPLGFYCRGAREGL
jgi:hypothetical protein